MSKFTTCFIGRLVGKNLWETYQKFEYHVGCYPSEEIIVVPKGFKTDFASIPRIFWPIISPIDTHGKAAVIHDYCYSIGHYNKTKCDLIFKEALRVLKVPEWKIFCMYWCVWLFGWIVWWRHRRALPRR